MKTLKFGGTSVGSPESIRQVIEIITERTKRKEKISVVVSAFSKVTDHLTNIGYLAASGNEDYKILLKDLEIRHTNAIKNLISIKKQSGVLANMKMMINDLDEVIRGVLLVKEVSLSVLDFIMSFGERLSAYIISEAIKDRGINCSFLDARELVKTDDHFGSARIDVQATYKNIRNYFKKHKELQIITGFISSTSKNQTTTLGRQGSDYSASIFGAALNAAAIEIWTDVDGVMTSDPREVKKAFPIKSLTYEEAMEMSYFGAKVIHPPTMQPAMEKNIPIVIKNTFNPKAPGTIVCRKGFSNGHLIKGISSISDIAILRVQGAGMVGVAGTSKRLFGALAKESVNVILITQASSEHSICVAINSKNIWKARRAVEEEFSLEIKTKLMEDVVLEAGLSIIAVVGENMRHRHGIAGKLFYALGKNGINLVAIAQGSSELNISAVINGQDEAKALNVIHETFFLSDTKSLNVFLLGTGLIGSTLLRQILQQKDFHKEQQSLEIKVIAVSNINKMYFDPEGMPIDSWQDLLKDSNEKMDLNKFIEKMKIANLPNSIFVDCTANKFDESVYLDILNSNISIVTPNKKANSGDIKYYKKLRETVAAHNVSFLYETNVGAGLPVISTLKELLSTGDRILKIEAILSGTLSYIFNSFVKGRSFSKIVHEAKEKGFTEPDPRDDLNGFDVARKMLILAREIGLNLELKDVKVKSLIPENCRTAKSVSDFFALLRTADNIFDKLKITAEKENKVLRYIATLENGKAVVALRSIDRDHPFFNISGSDNIISFTTERYKTTPLVIKGPGAGAEVTAAGVFADILRLAN